MAASVDDAELWLPSQFLAGDDLLGDKENKKNGGNADLDAAFCFPSEFPYEFESCGASSVLSSPVESVAGSTETESSDEEDFFTGLTRRLCQATLHETRQLTAPTCAESKLESQKCLGLARSPQSTLSGIGSWSGRSLVSGDGSPNGPSQVPSPPTTPFTAQNDAWDVIYAAVGQVARLKMNEVSKYDLQHRGILAPPHASTSVTAVKNPATTLYLNQSLPQTLNQSSQVQREQMLKQQCASVWGRQAKANWLAQQQQQIQNRVRTLGHEGGKCGRHLSMPQSAWPPLEAQYQSQQAQHFGSGPRSVAQGGSAAVKRSCGGTGVFLPRPYAHTQESRKKTSCAPVLLPAKVVHALNLNIDELNATSQSRYTGGFQTDYDALVARRNAILMQQRLSVRPEETVSHEIRLPQEWTY